MSSNAKLFGIAPILLVNDVKQTADHYISVFGFKLINYAGDPPAYGMVERDGFQVHFSRSSEAAKTNSALRPETPDFVIWVPGIELFREELRAKNAEVIQEITMRPYGRELILRDCNGYRILVAD